VTSMSDCLSTCISQEPHFETLPNFAVHVACGRGSGFSCGSTVIHYVLPVWLMMSFFPIMGSVTGLAS